MIILDILSLALLALFLVTGFVCIFFTTFGTLIMLAGTFLYASITRFDAINGKTMLILGLLYLIGEGAEYLTTIFGVKKFGASNSAIFGAILGGMIGAALGAALFGIGIIPGTFLGIFLGAFIAELIKRKDLRGSVKAGAGGVVGRLGSIAVKLVIAVAMIAVIVAKLL